LNWYFGGETVISEDITEDAIENFDE